MRLLALSAAAVLAVSCSSSSDPKAKRPAANPGNSRVALLAGSVAADGTTPATVTVTVLDDSGAAIAGAPVELEYAGTGTVTATRPTTDASGKAVFSVTSATPTIGAVTATVDATTLGNAPTLIFHGCEYGAFTNGACVPPPFVRLDPAVPATWGGIYPTQLAIGDLDGNALDDVAVLDTTGHAIRVFVSTGDGGLAPRATYAPAVSLGGLVVADVTGDAIADLVTTGWPTTLHVVPGAGDGTLRPTLTSTLSESLTPKVSADLDGDGDQDLVGTVSGGMGILLNGGGGAFGPVARLPTGTYTPSAIVVSDLDGDGKLDLVASFPNTDELEVRLGNGDGTFAPPVRHPTDPQPTFLALGDVDGDGDLDAVTTNRGSGLTWDVPVPVSVMLNAGNGTFGAATGYTAGLTPEGLTVADLDGDGMADVVTADGNGATVSVLHAAGGGTLAPPVPWKVPSIPVAVAAARLDPDASPDLVVLDLSAGTLSTLRGLGGMRFAAERRGPYAMGSQSVAAGDVTGDGLADLVRVGALSPVLRLDAGLGDGTFGSPLEVALPGDAPNGRRVALGDLDGAGGADAVALNLTTQEVSVLLASPGGLTLDATYLAGGRTEDLAIGDLDEDGRNDVVIASPPGFTSSANALRIFFGTGAGALSAETVIAAGGSPFAVALGDLNGDRHLDAVVEGTVWSSSTGSTELRVLLGDGTGALLPFATIAGLPPSGSLAGDFDVALADLDRDGKLDAVATDAVGAVQVFAGRGDGTFAPPVRYGVGRAPTAVALGDVNGDGFLDAVTADRASGTVTLLRGLGDGTFAPGAARAGLSNPGDVVIAELDGDGLGDVVVDDDGLSILPGSREGFAGFDTIPMGGSGDVEVADLNGDGRSDLVGIGTSILAVAMGTGPGTWAPATATRIGGYPNSLTIVDVNGDGRLDAVVTHDDPIDPSAPGPRFYGLGIALGNGDGTFGAEALYQDVGNVLRAAVGDLNGDSRADVVVPGPTSARLLLQNADGTFAPPVALPTAPPPEALLPPDPIFPPSDMPECIDVGLADVNGDGKLDLVAANAAPFDSAGVHINEVAILLGNGDGTFQPASRFALPGGALLLVTDLDGDGDVDVAARDNNSRMVLLLGDGLGAFARSEVDLALSAFVLKAADLDLDGRPDLVSTNTYNAFAAHRNAGAGVYESFIFSVDASVGSIGIGDLDGDGRPDLAVSTAAGVLPLYNRAP